MKAIVTCWIFPNESREGYDSRPKSVERISTSIEDLKSFMNVCSRNFGKYIEWADCLFDLDMRDEKKFNISDEIQDFYGGNGFLYLENLLKSDSLGTCVARMYFDETSKKEDAHYFLFQVRNIH